MARSPFPRPLEQKLISRDHECHLNRSPHFQEEPELVGNIGNSASFIARYKSIPLNDFRRGIRIRYFIWAAPQNCWRQRYRLRRNLAVPIFYLPRRYDWQQYRGPTAKHLRSTATKLIHPTAGFLNIVILILYRYIDARILHRCTD